MYSREDVNRIIDQLLLKNSIFKVFKVSAAFLKNLGIYHVAGVDQLIGEIWIKLQNDTFAWRSTDV